MSEPVLVLIHGFPFDHTMWDHVTALLDPSLRVLAPDLRGLGEQPIGDGEPSIDLMADDVAKLLDQQNIARTVVAGMSMGGYVALAFAQNHKERLAGLGLVSTQTIADTAEIRASRLALGQQVRREGPAAAVQAVLPKMFAPQNSEKPELVRFPLQAAERAGVSGIEWALKAMAHRPDRREFVKSLQVPVVVIHGAKDKLIPPKRAREMAGSIPNARFVQIAQAGHCTPLETPKEVAKALSRLVAESFADRFDSRGSIPALV
jgi:pimeloyl-ACP methyl ester carboxylesterase